MLSFFIAKGYLGNMLKCAKRKISLITKVNIYLKGVKKITNSASVMLVSRCFKMFCFACLTKILVVLQDCS